MKILTAAIKELLLLKRDRTGLLTLFIMPALLVIVITLVQENVMQLTGQKKTQVLVLDMDGGRLGDALGERLSRGNMEVILLDSSLHTRGHLREAVAAGDYQVGMVIEEGTSSKLHEKTSELFQHENSPAANEKVVPASISLFFDPGVMPGFRTGVKAQLQATLESIGMASKIERLGRELDILMERLGVPKEHAPLQPEELAERFGRPVLVLEEDHTDKQSIAAPDYNPVQQNVPAWAIFGMFFTAIPIAGTILQERRSGIWIRLASLPVSHLQLFGGKVLAYIGVCFSQFVLVGLIGFFLFPHLGLPAFTVTADLPGVLLTTCCISLAACGFGIVLGMLCNSYEQASAVGACFVVASAAIGGVMVPVYAMPELMQHLSIVSPLNWGLGAFQDLLVRGYPITAIGADLGRLVLFFLITIIVAWKLRRMRA